MYILVDLNEIVKKTKIFIETKTTFEFFQNKNSYILIKRFYIL